MRCAHCGHDVGCHNDMGTSCKACLAEVALRERLESLFGETDGFKLAHAAQLAEFDCHDFDH